MIVAVETNFVLELALQQAEARHAEAILQLAEAGEIQLAVPAFAFAEAHAKLVAQSKKRNVLRQDIETEIHQMKRCQPYASIESNAESFVTALDSCGKVHAEVLADTADRLRACATVISLTKEVTRDTSSLRVIFKAQPGDVFIYASVYRYLREAGDVPKIFATRDKGFGPTEDLLAEVGCRLVLSFGAALAAIKHEIDAAAVLPGS